MRVDAGLRPAREEEVVKARNYAARALQGLFRELGLPPITDEEVEAATYADGSKDMPERNVNEDLKAVEEMMNRGTNGVDIIRALDKAGFKDVAHAIFNMMKQRVSGDYLHTAAIVTSDWEVQSAVNKPNTYQGPMTGYQMTEERWNEIKDLPWAVDPETI